MKITGVSSSGIVYLTYYDWMTAEELTRTFWCSEAEGNVFEFPTPSVGTVLVGKRLIRSSDNPLRATRKTLAEVIEYEYIQMRKQEVIEYEYSPMGAKETRVDNA